MRRCVRSDSVARMILCPRKLPYGWNFDGDTGTDGAYPYTFKNGATGIGSATLSGGVATISKSNLAVGTHSITASYHGDSESGESTSPVLDQVVQ
jgi:hypothetical protein